MWIAKRAMRFGGKDYRPGDQVPAEGSRNRVALQQAGWITGFDEAGPEVVAEGDAWPRDETYSIEWTRAQLDAYAASLGIEAPDALPNKAAVLEAIEERLTAPEDEAESDPEDDGESEPEANGDEDGF